jgi:hypothetical protein
MPGVGKFGYEKLWKIFHTQPLLTVGGDFL